MSPPTSFPIFSCCNCERVTASCRIFYAYVREYWCYVNGNLRSSVVTVMLILPAGTTEVVATTIHHFSLSATLEYLVGFICNLCSWHTSWRLPLHIGHPGLVGAIQFEQMAQHLQSFEQLNGAAPLITLQISASGGAPRRGSSGP